MTFEDLANIIRTRFKTQIADVYSLTTQYDNQKLDKPNNILWCRLTINYGKKYQVGSGGPGNNRYRTPGIMTAQLFCPIGNGDKDILAMADKIDPAFRCKTDTGVKFGTPGIHKAGRVKSEWQINVNCPFYADDVG